MMMHPKLIRELEQSSTILKSLHMFTETFHYSQHFPCFLLYGSKFSFTFDHANCVFVQIVLRVTFSFYNPEVHEKNTSAY